MARSLTVAVAVVASLLAVSGAGEAATQQAPKRGGAVVFGPISGFACLNPLVAACASGSVPSNSVLEKVVAPAFLDAPDFTLRPRLVSSASFTRRPPFTLTYEIRREARWSDGVPVTARDFVFTHRAILENVPADSESVLTGDRTMVRSVRAIDRKTVRVVLRTRFADWRSLFSVVLPAHALTGEDLTKVWSGRIDNPKTGRPIGSGPFLVERLQRGKQLTLVRNPHYWGPHPAYLDRLVIRFCEVCTAPPPAEVLEAVRQGEVDFVLARDTGIVPDLRRIRGVKVLAMRSTGWEHLAIRIGPGGHTALRNKLVRRALAYGIDRLAIVRQLFGSIDPTYRPSDSAAFLNTSRYYVPNWTGYRYRPGLARRLLAQAGCRPGADDIYSCAGERLSFRFFTTAGTRLRERGLELIQAQLRQAGVEVLPVFAPPATLFGQIMPSGGFDGVSFTYFVGDSIASKDIFGCGSAPNFTGYCQRLVTRDLDQVDRILDASQRARVLNRADRQLAKDVPVIPLYQVPFVIAYRTTVRNVVPAPSNLFWNAENWWLER